MNIIMEHNHIKYPNKYEIVTDGRTLEMLVNRGFIQEYDRSHKYVESGDFRLNTSERINGIKYKIEYFDGCFMPFVCKVIEHNKDINLNNKGGDDVK